MTILLNDRIELLNYLPFRGIVAELGVFKGEYTQEIIRVCKPQELHLVDTDISKINIKYDESKTKVYIHNINDLEWLVNYEEYFDWLYIDTLHTYEHTKQELILSHHAIKKGGFICGHDYTHVCACGPKENWHRYGVIEAVNEFCEKFNYKLLYLTNESHRFLSYVIQAI